MEASKSKVVKEYEKSVRQLRSKSEQTIDELKKQREESTQKVCLNYVFSINLDRSYDIHVLNEGNV